MVKKSFERLILHKDFVPTTIAEATQADTVVLVINVYVGVLKDGFDRLKGQTREHVKGCGADRVLTDPSVIRDLFWGASKAGVLSVLDGWLETKPSLFVYLGHVGMVG
ncbi:hypothetical protein F2Q70_00021669 [Brassica cretica]|uniref:Uncharacterized protein n=1 Tax=Brassica cretica TaxID=69181 RepID=A0A8S9H069_BRACR|nr:hypothetical protein F2Q70_00021669 [Brassica cretica]